MKKSILTLMLMLSGLLVMSQAHAYYFFNINIQNKTNNNMYYLGYVKNTKGNNGMNCYVFSAAFTMYKTLAPGDSMNLSFWNHQKVRNQGVNDYSGCSDNGHHGMFEIYVNNDLYKVNFSGNAYSGESSITQPKGLKDVVLEISSSDYS